MGRLFLNPVLTRDWHDVIDSQLFTQTPTRKFAPVMSLNKVTIG